MGRKGPLEPGAVVGSDALEGHRTSPDHPFAPSEHASKAVRKGTYRWYQ